MSKNFKLIMKESAELGLETVIIYPEREVAEIKDASKSIIIKESFSFAENPASESFRLSKNKEITNRLWAREGIPFPRSRYFKSRKHFPRDASKLGLRFPVVFKKASGAKSIGVYPNINSFSALELIVQNFQDGFIVQEMAFGTEYRILIYEGHVLDALEMVPPLVIGNGKDTILTLAHLKNIKLDKKIIINEKVTSTLKKNKMTTETIPAEGERVLLQENSCLAEGGSTIDRTDIVHKKIRTLAAKAARAVNLKLAGLDLICENIAVDPDNQKIAFLEANSFPSLDIHYEPTIGPPRKVIRPILSDIFNL